jgi:murein DD-endopeptidase MepM/ murein hydrolase activator NlpD
VAPDQRHAYDFLVWRAGATHRGSGARNSDYWAWGKRVLAPASGQVVAAVDGVHDNRPQVEVENPGEPAGNHVVLDLGNGEYALLAHFRKGSLAVRKGDRVSAGDILGRVGNSGNSSEPHLHFHVQDRPGLFGAARGLPLAFVDYRADGRRVARGTPVQGQFVERAP